MTNDADTAVEVAARLDEHLRTYAHLSDRILRQLMMALHTRGIATVLYHRSFPVDVRHNAKIFREELAAWAQAKLGRAERKLT